jgi:hypothetical protein
MPTVSDQGVGLRDATSRGGAEGRFFADAVCVCVCVCVCVDVRWCVSIYVVCVSMYV